MVTSFYSQNVLCICYTISMDRCNLKKLGSIWAGVALVATSCGLSACGASNKAQKEFGRAEPPTFYAGSQLSSVADPELVEHVKLLRTNVASEGLKDASEVSLGVEGSEVVKKCGIKDKFDRDALLAYQMNDGKLSLDVDGLGYGSQKVEKVYLNYSVSLQPDLVKKDACQYASRYKGILGSAYSELVVHDGENLRNEMHDIRSKVGNVVTAFIN